MGNRDKSSELSRERWKHLCTRLNFAEDEATFSALADAYSQPHRAYHTARHINECLEWLDVVEWQLSEPALVEVAIWFHDSVYNPAANDNEEASAQWAQDWMQKHAAPHADTAIVRTAILATRHDHEPVGDIAEWVADIDLAILGAPAERFDEYEEQVRREYRWIPGFLFNRQRAELLEAFLERQNVYSTEFFSRRLEASARQNLQRALEKLAKE